MSRKTISALCLGCLLSVSILGGVAGAVVRVIYVDPTAKATDTTNGISWARAYPNLQDALVAGAEAIVPVEIRMAQGVYKPDQGTGVMVGDKEATFQLIEGMTIKGGYAGLAGGDSAGERDATKYETILSGDLDGGFGRRSSSASMDGSKQVVTGILTDETTIIDGLTIAGGQKAMVIDDGRLALSNVTFRDNWWGLDTLNAELSLAKCTFIDNNRAIYAWYSTYVMTGCVFEDNDAGVTIADDEATLTDCVFTGHNETALSCSGVLQLRRCSFEDNDDWTGVVLCNGILEAQECTFASNSATTILCMGNGTCIDCRFIGNMAWRASPAAIEAMGYTFTATRCVFAGNTSRGFSGIVTNYAVRTLFTNCIFAGNDGGESAPGAIWNQGYRLNVTNCTFVGNLGLPRTIESPSEALDVQLTGCIVRDGADPFTKYEGFPPTIDVRYSNIEGGYEGQGNIDVDPEFVQAGYWADREDPNVEVNPDDAHAVWVMGDYHLKSKAGHWDPDVEDWVYDDATSPCIDMGDPNSPLGGEVFPNGGYVNMGAYGGTAQASRPYFGGPVCETELAGDINGDCVVDQTDLDILLSHWLGDSTETENTPPTISVVSPQDGAEISYPDPIIFRFDVSDSDGDVVRISIDLTHDHGNGTFYSSSGISGLTDNNWELEYDWSRIRYDGLYVVEATAVDNDGATATMEFTMTLHPE